MNRTSYQNASLSSPSLILFYLFIFNFIDFFNCHRSTLVFYELKFKINKSCVYLEVEFIP